MKVWRVGGFNMFKILINIENKELFILITAVPQCTIQFRKPDATPRPPFRARARPAAVFYRCVAP